MTTPIDTALLTFEFDDGHEPAHVHFKRLFDEAAGSDVAVIGPHAAHSADFGSPDQERDERGRWAAVASALTAAHQPPTGPDLPHPPGLGSPKMLAENPALAALAATHAERAGVFWRATVAQHVKDYLTGPPPKIPPLPGPTTPLGQQVGRVKRLAEATATVAAHMTQLGPALARHQEPVAASHPEGHAALAATRAEMQRRHDLLFKATQEHIAALPEAMRPKAEKYFHDAVFADFAAADFTVGFAIGPPLPWTPADMDRMATVTDADLDAAEKRWRELAPDPMKRLLDAKAKPKE